jgi:hypothetical protein
MATCSPAPQQTDVQQLTPSCEPSAPLKPSFSNMWVPLLQYSSLPWHVSLPRWRVMHESSQVGSSDLQEHREPQALSVLDCFIDITMWRPAASSYN